MQSSLALIDESERAQAMLDPLRLEILERLRDPDSAAGIARAMGLPRQRIGYHVRELERKGLLRHVGDRKKGNCIERLVQASAQHYLIGPRALGPVGADPERVRDRFSSAYLVAVAAQTIRDVGELREQAASAEKKLPTLTVQGEVRFASPAAQHAYAEELASFLAQLAARYHDDSDRGRTFRFVLQGYPAPERKNP